MLLRASVFFLTRENEKCPRKRFLVLFWFFFSGGNGFSRPLLENFLGQFEVFSGTFSIFFSGWLVFFSGRNLRIFSGIVFFLGQTFLFSGRQIFNGLIVDSLVLFCKIPTGSELLLLAKFLQISPGQAVSAMGKMKIRFLSQVTQV